LLRIFRKSSGQWRENCSSRSMPLADMIATEKQQLLRL
jgi:hypothetical protein